MSTKQYSFLVTLLLLVGVLCVGCIFSHIITIKKIDNDRCDNLALIDNQTDSIGDYLLFELDHITPVGSISVLDSVITPSSVIKYVVNTECGAQVIYTTIAEFVDCCIWIEGFHHFEYGVSNNCLNLDGTRNGLMDSMLDIYHHIIAYIHYDRIGDKIVLRNDWVRQGRNGGCSDYEIYKYLGFKDSLTPLDNK